MFIMLLCAGLAGRSACQEDPAAPGTCARGRALATSQPFGKSGFTDSTVHVTYYRLQLSITPSPPLLRGVVSAEVVCTAESTSTVMFDLAGTMIVDSVLSGGTRLQISRFLQGYQMDLGRTLRKGDTLTLETHYGGVPAPTGYGSFEISSEGGYPWIWSLSEPYGARDWWPCKDDNSDKADSVDMEITIPAGLRAGSNGRLAGVRDNGDGTSTYHWSERYPIAAYLVSLAVGNFQEYDDWFRYSPSDSMQVVNYVLPPSNPGEPGALAETPMMLRIFSDTYGLYPFIREKYGHSQFGWGGAMEHQTMTSTSTFDELTIAHELAHQWFGDMITCANWPNLWLNEGFATYSEAVFLEKARGVASYWSFMAGNMSSAMSAQGTLYVQDTSTVPGLFEFDRVYAKGSWTLHMLRHVLGDSVFFRSMRAYAADPRFRYRNASTEGFRSACEAVSGRDLGFFFNEWVYGEGYPSYIYDWKSAPAAGGYTVILSLTQTGTSPATPVFSMPVDIEITGVTGDTTASVFFSIPAQTFALHVPFEPVTVSIDPSRWILRDVTPVSAILPTAFKLEQNYPNPFNPGTSIDFALPHRSDVTLVVYDVLGRRVAVIFQGREEAGKHSVRWEGIDGSGRPVGAGTYFLRLTAGDFTQTRRMVLIR